MIEIQQPLPALTPYLGAHLIPSDVNISYRLKFTKTKLAQSILERMSDLCLLSPVSLKYTPDKSFNSNN
jgi:hypothetical protein